MYKTIIIDDELNCIEVLEILINKKFNDLQIVETFTSSKKALEYLKSNQVDLVFMDIQMPFMTGIDLLSQLDTHPFNIIFTTAYDQYAIAAIKLSALDYLLKPIDEDLLSISVDRFRKYKAKHNVENQISQLIQQYTVPSLALPTYSQSNTKIAVSFQDKILFYESSEILFCHSNDNYTTLNLNSGEKVIASKTIKYFEDLLTPMGFVRPHQSYIVNSKYIQQYNKKDGGFLVMNDGTSIPVSRNRKEEILQLFKGES